jgi:hypothetical protein
VVPVSSDCPDLDALWISVVQAMLGRSSGDEVKSELGASDDEEVVKGPRSR